MVSPRPAQIDFSGIFRRPPPATLWLMIVTAVASVATMASFGWGSGSLARWILFSPSSVLDSWRVWTPFTWLFVIPQPFGLIFHELFLLWMFAAQLESHWGTRRFLYYFFATGTGAAIVTILIALVAAPLRFATFDASWVVGEAVIVGWVLMNWHATVYFLFFPVRAPYLLIFSVVIPLLYAIQGAWMPLIPAFSAMGIGYVMLNHRGPSLRRAYLHARAWWIERQLKRRARHLRVVEPEERREDPERGKYLH